MDSSQPSTSTSSQLSSIPNSLSPESSLDPPASHPQLAQTILSPAPQATTLPCLPAVQIQSSSRVPSCSKQSHRVAPDASPLPSTSAAVAPVVGPVLNKALISHRPLTQPSHSPGPMPVHHPLNKPGLSSPKLKDVLMTKLEVVHVKQLADELLISHDLQAQRLRTQITRLTNYALALDDARCTGLLSSKRKIDTLNDYIHSLTLTKQSSTNRLELQSTEIDLLKRQAIALSHKVTASPIRARNLPSPSPRGIGKRKTDENFELEHDHLAQQRNSAEFQNKILLIEKKTLETKLEQAEAQIQRLSKEFKKLRSFLVTTRLDSLPTPTHQTVTSGGAEDEHDPPDRGRFLNSRHGSLQNCLPGISPTPIDRPRQSLSRSELYKRRPTMGDADAEHLLLASERLTSISRSRTLSSLGGPYQVSPSIKLASQRSVDRFRPSQTPSALGLTGRRLSAPMSAPVDPEPARTLDQQLAKTDAPADHPKDAAHMDEDDEEKVLEKMIVPNRLTFTSLGAQPPKEPKRASSRGERAEKRVGLMDDLLAAAETVLTRVSSPECGNSSEGSGSERDATQRKKCKLDHLPPVAGQRAPAAPPDPQDDDAATETVTAAAAATGGLSKFSSATTVGTGLSQYSSGLDVLAATASQTQDGALSPTSPSSSSLSPCSAHQTYTPPSPHASYSSELSDAAPEDDGNNFYDDEPERGAGPASQRGRKRAKTGAERAGGSLKKMRSAYVKWTGAEDEQLVQAVSQYGQRWEAVSKCVPSRSYHQCRQRWLRGLKGGENLPVELRKLYPAIQMALKVYQLSRKRQSTSTISSEVNNPVEGPVGEMQSQDHSKLTSIGSDSSDDLESDHGGDGDGGDGGELEEEEEQDEVDEVESQAAAAAGGVGGVGGDDGHRF